ncbi:GNAT family N-acetyltransferase [Macrococcus equipercicus]|uniref:GNAT family N-acetyltransferase n=1 Tax=Macrococcus equipercicus TaxID=69967 RepID=A0ABQ6R7Y8_9STAP|nr:GNAT family N-acetyltransferase [Macrococcus equipercicus]KAA1039193.1 GNAT family N-acetyltransferase [Macrococcus equipercicus]
MIDYIKPALEHKSALKAHYKRVITHTFQVDGIDDAEDLQHEIDTKYSYIERYYRQMDVCFIIAKDDKQIIGGIASYRPNSNIDKMMKGKLNHLYEIGSLYVNPAYQGQGIGSTLIRQMQEELRAAGIREFCFDASYTLAIKTWTKMFGPATYVVKDYWGEGGNHHIWVVTL